MREARVPEFINPRIAHEPETVTGWCERCKAKVPVIYITVPYAKNGDSGYKQIWVCGNTQNRDNWRHFGREEVHLFRNERERKMLLNGSSVETPPKSKKRRKTSKSRA